MFSIHAIRKSAMKYQNILFDLDGTLTDPKVGITRSVAHALRYFGIEVADTDTLTPFIGPPLAVSFHELYGFNDAQCTKAIEVYREYFSVTGKFENEVYPYTERILAHLKARGARLFVATSKPEKFAREILEHFGLDRYFDDIIGIAMDEEKVEKDVIVRRVLDRYALDRQMTLMVGDRCFDIDSAHKNGIPCVAVGFGYGSDAEFEEYGADAVAKTNEQLYNYFKGMA